jgi:Large ribosomal RNA subunit accumulation protein YceD
MKNQRFLQIQVKNLPEEGMQLQAELTAQDLEIPDEDRISIVESVQVSFHIAPIVGALVVSGCDRCLAYFTTDFPSVRIDHQYLDFHADVLDLTEDVREDILLAFPSRCLCHTDCKGLCPDCGQNLNVRECGCQDEAPEESPWQALEKLHLPGSENPETGSES